MAMTAQLSENSHQGFDGIKAALCLASTEVNSNTASEMPVCLWQNGIGSRSTGKERDAETGLDYFGARYLSAAQGRFLSPDPGNAGASIQDPQSWNAYAYARNNPLSYVDPTGLAYMLCMPGGSCTTDYRDTEFFHNFWYQNGHDGLSLNGSLESGNIFSKGNYIGYYFRLSIEQQPIEDGHIESADTANFAIGGLFKSAIFGFADLMESFLLPTRTAVKEGIATQTGTKITGFTKHGIDRAVGDAAKRAGTKPEAILDALKNPVKTTKGIDSLGRPFELYVGKTARVVVNPETGKIVSVNPLSGAGAH
jgi:RHS repeat-associated protein